MLHNFFHVPIPLWHHVIDIHQNLLSFRQLQRSPEMGISKRFTLKISTQQKKNILKMAKKSHPTPQEKTTKLSLNQKRTKKNKPSAQSCGGSFSNSNGSPPRLPFLPPGAARAAAARRITVRFRCMGLAREFQLEGIEREKKKPLWLKSSKNLTMFTKFGNVQC